MRTARKQSLLFRLGPGMLVAATGIGAGDLATAAFSGSKLGIAILWAVVVGAVFKFVLNEGLTRWQLATGSTLLEGTCRQLGRSVCYLFLGYLLIWTYMVSAALMSACGVVAQSILPLSGEPATDKIIYGILLSLLAVLLIRLGGYRLFEKVMSVCIGLMFITVVVTAVLLVGDWPAVITGLIMPSIPHTAEEAESVTWTIALIGGVGGTVTILSYGYWIREKGWINRADLYFSRWDLAVSYGLTALFGLAMVIIGSTIRIEGQGVRLIVKLAERLAGISATGGKWMFLLGAFGAVFSSMLGVWQSVPYLFTDLLSLIKNKRSGLINTASKPYRWYLYGMALIPVSGLWTGFVTVQKFYAVFGALFIPMLAVVLLMLNSRTKFIGKEFRNRPLTTVMLLVILIFFGVAALITVIS